MTFPLHDMQDGKHSWGGSTQCANCSTMPLTSMDDQRNVQQIK